MAEAVTYADLRFVKAPLKKTLSSKLGQDQEAYEDEDEDGELTYENVQVPSVPAGAKGLASSGLGDRGTVAEPPAAPWSSVMSPPAGLRLPCRVPCLQYSLLGLLITSLLLGIAAICLGVRYLQVSQHLQQKNRVLEATNSSLLQQLHLKITQLGQKEKDLQGSRAELAQSQEELTMERKDQRATEEQLRATKEQLQACQRDREKTRQDLQREEQQRLSSMNTMKAFFTCTSPEDSCCPVGWILNKELCYYFSPTKKTWKDSQSHCTLLSAKLATLREIPEIHHFYYSEFPHNIRELLSHGESVPYWTDPSSTKRMQYSRNCITVTQSKIQYETCAKLLHYICEREALRLPDGGHTLP